METYPIEYEFRFEDGERRVFKIELDPETTMLIHPKPAYEAEWARLSFHKCLCCPLMEDTTLFCPIAVNMSWLVEDFNNMISVSLCVVRCTTPERTIIKRTSIQNGLFSIFGIIMATSGCPVMGFFKPMARFHLPFSTIEENVLRAVSNYLIRQYFMYRKGMSPDMDLRKLNDYYKKVQMVNEGILKRLNAHTRKDASRNAMMVLHSLSQIFALDIDDNMSAIEHLFE